MSEEQLNGQNESPPGTTRPGILSGHGDPERVVETAEMRWLGAEGGVIYPEGDSYVLTR